MEKKNMPNEINGDLFIYIQVIERKCNALEVEYEHRKMGYRPVDEDKMKKELEPLRNEIRRYIKLKNILVDEILNDDYLSKYMRKVKNSDLNEIVMPQRARELLEPQKSSQEKTLIRDMSYIAANISTSMMRNSVDDD